MLPGSLKRASPRDLPELMDDPECDAGALHESLEAIGRANRWAGTTRVVWRALRSMLEPLGPRRVRVLDVGAGIGDLALAVYRRLAAAGAEPELVLADLHGEALRIARRSLRGAKGGPARLDFVRLDAPLLPFRDGAFDIAFSSTVLHHLEDDDAVSFLSELDRVSSRGWIASDLRRSRPAYAAMRLLAATAWRSKRLPRTDGPISVRRAFSEAEARELVGRAGLSTARVSRIVPFRLAIAGPARP